MLIESWNIPGVLEMTKKAVKAKLELTGQFVSGEAKLLCPVGETSNLKNSITYQVETDAVKIGSPVDYAPHVELGTKPHVIEAKNAKALAFKIGGQLIFAKKVNHPGTEPHPFLRPAVLNNKQRIMEIWAL
jgi:hypothetical protein